MIGRTTGRVEVIARVSGRLSWTVEQKLAMLRDAFGPGGSVRAARERYELTSGLLYTWRRQAMSGQLGATGPSRPAFAEVRVAEPALSAPALPGPPPVGDGVGRITIELPSGVRLSVDATVDANALARVLEVLAG
ncbi:MAG TPA: transposase [Sphingomonadaceae bacterium]|nr:transposase [Sphingomonadaceae bacterium]